MKIAIYRKPIPRDMLASFRGQDPQLIGYLLGNELYHSAEQRNIKLTLMTGRYDFNMDYVETVIYAEAEKDLTFWILENSL